MSNKRSRSYVQHVHNPPLYSSTVVFHSRSERLDHTLCGSTIIHYCPIPYTLTRYLHPHHPFNTRDPTTTHPARGSGDSSRGLPLKVCRGRPRWRTWAWRRTCPGCPWRWCCCCAPGTCSRSPRGTWSPSCGPRATSWSRSGGPSPRPWRPPSSWPGRTSERWACLLLLLLLRLPKCEREESSGFFCAFFSSCCRFVEVVVAVSRV